MFEKVSQTEKQLGVQMSQAVRKHNNSRYVFRRFAALAVLVGGAGLFIAGQSASASNETAGPVAFELITVESGQSLWGLAELYAPGTDARDWIAQVIDLNALGSADLYPGQQLAVPGN
jgi:LysM repeat protein